MLNTNSQGQTSPSKWIKTPKTIAAIFVAVVILAGGGAYLASQVFAEESPPSLEVAMNLQGLSKVGTYQFAEWDDDDKIAFNINKAAAAVDETGETEIKKGVNYLHAEKDITFKDVFHMIDPSAETMAVAKYNAETSLFDIYPKTTYYKQSATHEVVPEDAIIKKGEGFIVITTAESESYGLSVGTSFKNVKAEIGDSKKGWNLYSIKDTDLKRAVAPYFKQIESIWILNEGVFDRAMYKEGDNANVVRDKVLENSIVWIEFNADAEASDVHPSAPENVVAEAGEGLVNLKWDVPASSGTSDLDYYEVEYYLYDEAGEKADTQFDIGTHSVKIPVASYSSEKGSDITVSTKKKYVYGFLVHAVNELGYKSELTDPSQVKYMNPLNQVDFYNMTREISRGISVSMESVEGLSIAPGEAEEVMVLTVATDKTISLKDLSLSYTGEEGIDIEKITLVIGDNEPEVFTVSPLDDTMPIIMDLNDHIIDGGGTEEISIYVKMDEDADTSETYTLSVIAISIEDESGEEVEAEGEYPFLVEFTCEQLDEFTPLPPTSLTFETTVEGVTLKWVEPELEVENMPESYQITHYTSVSGTMTATDIEVIDAITETEYLFDKEDIGDKHTFEVKAFYGENLYSEAAIEDYVIVDISLGGLEGVGEIPKIEFTTEEINPEEINPEETLNFSDHSEVYKYTPLGPLGLPKVEIKQ